MENQISAAVCKKSKTGVLNSDEALLAQFIFQATAKIHNYDAARDARKEYKTLVASIEETNAEIYLTDDQMKLNHDDYKKRALEVLEKHQMGQDASNSELLNHLIMDIDEDFGNWKNSNEHLKDRIINLNESALKDAAKIYSSTMNEWMETSKIPFSTQVLNDQNMMIQEAATDHLKSALKGPVNFNLRLPFLNRLQEIMKDHFTSFIVVQNESKKKEEKYNLEMTRLKDLLKQEKARRKGAEVEVAASRLAEEVAKREAAECKAARQAERAEATLKIAEIEATLIQTKHQSQLDGERRAADFRLRLEQQSTEAEKKRLEVALSNSKSIEYNSCSIQ